MPQRTPHGLHPTSSKTRIYKNNFASAHSARIASRVDRELRAPLLPFASAHPARIASDKAVENIKAVRLCLSTSRTDCIFTTSRARQATASLPQHIPHGLHQQNCTDATPQIHAICCEPVDSFSDATKAASALTIFPRSSTVKAIYIAISDSLGRTIDRFWGANRTEKIC